MNYKRVTFGSLLCVAFLALVADPVAAQYNTPTERLIKDLNLKLLYIAIPITLLVEGILFYTVVKFRNNENPSPTEENRRLEITWTIATALILLFVGVASYGVMAEIITPQDAQPGDDDVSIHVEGYRWAWDFTYTEENVETTGTMVIPVNQQVHLNITSTDWIHAFHAPELGLKQDAVPGSPHALQFTAENEGEYTLYCAEYCGDGHSQMLGTIEVVSEEEYQQWLDENREDGGSGSDGGDGDDGSDGDNDDSGDENSSSVGSYATY